MRLNKDIVVITADLGYKMFDLIKTDYPDRFINVGASEQTMMDMAVGVALQGKLPICYTISPFYSRAFETIRNYLLHEGIKVIMIGSGRGKDYLHDGFSHWDDYNNYCGDFSFFPDDEQEMILNFKTAITCKKPCYINLKR